MNAGYITDGAVHYSDYLECEYDSTWEDEDDDQGRNRQERKVSHRQLHWHYRNLIAAKDMQNYRHGYPYASAFYKESEQYMNLKFYLNKVASSPDGVTIDEFHTQWWRDYRRLEMVHSYIQWLFPLQESGMNYCAYDLTKNEIKAFCSNEDAKRRLKMSYKLMLDFYGIKLVDEKTGKVDLAENWEERFENLNRHMHNNLRITRILKCLGELGFEHYQVPLVQFFLEQTLVMKKLENVKESMMDYFLFSVRNKKQRQKLVEFAFKHYTPKKEFVWCPVRVQRRLEEKEHEENKETCSQEKKNPDCFRQCHGASAKPPVPQNGSRKNSSRSVKKDVEEKERTEAETQEHEPESLQNGKNEKKVEISDTKKAEQENPPLLKCENNLYEGSKCERDKPKVNPKDDRTSTSEPHNSKTVAKKNLACLSI